MGHPREKGMIRFNPRIWVTAIVKTPLSSWLSFFRIFFLFLFFSPYLAFSHVARVAARDHSLFFPLKPRSFFSKRFFQTWPRRDYLLIGTSVLLRVFDPWIFSFLFFPSFRIWDAFQVKINEILKYCQIFRVSDFYDLLLKFRFVLMGRTNIFMMNREVEVLRKMIEK